MNASRAERATRRQIARENERYVRELAATLGGRRGVGRLLPSWDAMAEAARRLRRQGAASDGSHAA